MIGGLGLKNNRIFEIDLLRVVAICLMIVFHFVYDLNEFAGVAINYEAPLWHFIGKISAITFIFVAGISAGFSRNSFKRGFKVLGFGMILTIVTYFFDATEFIRFGILHFLGVAMISFPLLNKLRKWQLSILALVSIYIGSLAAKTTVVTHLLLPFGFMYNNFATMDYYPIFPYISVFLFGIIIYKIYYFKGKGLIKIHNNYTVLKYISKNSLFIYLVHQPILLGIILIIKYVK